MGAEMYEYNGKFYLIFSAQGYNGLHSIEIAVCDTPNGKFKPLGDSPFYSPDFSVIDGSLFFDDDGRIYMYYSKDCSTNTVNGKRTSQTWGVEVKSDFSGTIGEHVLISTPEQAWELKSGSVLWNEGPVGFQGKRDILSLIQRKLLCIRALFGGLRDLRQSAAPV